jgi:hypothetical protein
VCRFLRESVNLLGVFLERLRDGCRSAVALVNCRDSNGN